MDIKNITEEEIMGMDEEQLQELNTLMGGSQEDVDTDVSYGSPTPEKKDTQLQLFRDIIATEDSKKVAYLKPEELGKVSVGVRQLHNIALFCETQNIPGLAEYYLQKAEIIQATSMSSKGFLLQTIVTQIKKELKQRMSSEPKKGRWFEKKQQEVPNE